MEFVFDEEAMFNMGRDNLQTPHGRSIPIQKGGDMKRLLVVAVLLLAACDTNGAGKVTGVGCSGRNGCFVNVKMDNGGKKTFHVTRKEFLNCNVGDRWPDCK